MSRYDQLPEELRNKQRFLLWCLEDSNGRKRCKVPKNAAGRSIDPNNPENWLTLDEALRAQLQPDPTYKEEKNATGIGLAITGPYFAVDVDHCLDPESGRLANWARDLVEQFPKTYTEVSPSGRGLHLWFRCSEHQKLPEGIRTKDLEVYAKKRYFTVTGERWEESPLAVTELDYAEAIPIFRAVDQRRQGANKELSTTSPTITKLVRKEDQELALLMDGKIVEAGFSDPTGDSEADFRLCSILAKRFNGNRDLVERFWRSSGLWREKLNRADYRNRTLEKALANFRERDSTVDPETWRDLFHTLDETINAPPPEWLVENFVELQDTVMIGGLSGHGKTLIMLSVVRALLTGKPLFGHPDFKVPRVQQKILYLIPEVGLRSFARRLRLFELEKYVGTSLFYRTLSAPELVTLADARILCAAEGAHVFLDTAIRFTEGDEQSSSDNQRGLAQRIFNLQAAGAFSVWGAHHSPKEFRRQDAMTLENVLRGSGDIGAMLSTAYGIKQLDEDRSRTLIQVECIKPRDIDPPSPFQVEGKPWIDTTHDFQMVKPPGNCGYLAEELSNLQGNNSEYRRAREMFEEGVPQRKVATELKKSLGFVNKLHKRWEESQRTEKAGLF